MKCKDCEERLSAYAAGELAESEKVIIKEHLDRCQACRGVLAAEMTVRGRLALLSSSNSSIDLTGSVMARIKSGARTENAKASKRTQPRSMRLVLRLGVAGILVAVLVGSLVLALPHTPSSVPVSAGEIALADPRVQATFTTEELRHIGVQVLDGNAGQKFVMLSANTGSMVLVGVDMVANQVNQVLIDARGVAQDNAPAYQLIFDSNMNGTFGIYTIAPDSSHLTKLTGNMGGLKPTWSPARQQIALVAGGTSALSGIYAMDYNGNNFTQLVSNINNMAVFDNPTWSPDGSRLAFSASPSLAKGASSYSYDLYTVTGPGLNKGLTRLTNLTSITANWPQWSPDGSKIAFYTMNADSWALHVINADGSGLRTLASGQGGMCNNFSWSPDGQFLVYAWGNDRTDMNTYDIYTINLNGTSQMRLTDNSSNDMAPTWSPDGTKIAFRSNREGYDAIYVMAPDGSSVTRLTDKNILSPVPKWSPDGKEITFTGNVGTSELPEWWLFIMNADGTGQTKLAYGAIPTVNWAKLPTYPTPTVSQDITITPTVKPPPVTAVPQTVVTVGAFAPRPTGVAQPPSDWPVNQQEAVKQALSYLPSAIASKAKVRVDIGWSPPGWGLGEPYWIIYLTGFSLTQQELGWESQYNVTSTGGQELEFLPVTLLEGQGPYSELIVTLSGLNNSLRYRFAFMSEPKNLPFPG